MARPKTLKTLRPLPPEDLGKFVGDTITNFAPAPEVLEWLQREIIAEGGSLHNADHQHLESADFAVLWASAGYQQKGNWVAGTAEELTFRCGKWQKLRQEQQMEEWFGRVPSFLITLDASYAKQCADLEFCALVEHELYHLGHKLDDFGQPAYDKEGNPKLSIRGHDVEEFVGIVRRYGVQGGAGKTAELVAAAQQRPEVSGLNVARACGTCMLRAA